MRLSEVLPYLEAGRRVRRASWVATGYEWFVLGPTAPSRALANTTDLLASDWEVVEEPAPAKPDPRPHVCSCNEALRQDVARLTRERDEAKARGDGMADSAATFHTELARLRAAIKALP